MSSRTSEVFQGSRRVASFFCVRWYKKVGTTTLTQWLGDKFYVTLEESSNAGKTFVT